MSIKSAADAARAEVDRKWHERYPNGMFYVVLLYQPQWVFDNEARNAIYPSPAWTIQHGVMTRRPTSGGYRGKCYVILPKEYDNSTRKIGGHFVSSSFCKRGDKRKTFDNEKDYLLFLERIQKIAEE